MTPLRRLIVNADGFGLSAGTNRAIMECLAAGFVRSTSVNVNFPAAQAVPDLVREFPRVSAGLHVNLAVGRPVCPPDQVPSLVDDRGLFWDTRFRWRLLRGRIRADHLRREIEAQFLRMRELAGEITHWDGHRNEHLLPGYFENALRIAQGFGVRRMRCHRHRIYLGLCDGTWSHRAHYVRRPARALRHSISGCRTVQARRAGMRTADRLITPAKVSPDSCKPERAMWESLVAWLPPGTSEIYCHPGYPDASLREHARYVEPRRAEVAALSAPGPLEKARREGVSPISFREL